MRLYLVIIIFCVFLTGCAKPPAAQFSYYEPNNAWDAALLFTMDCNDYIDSQTCFNKKAELGDIYKSTFSIMKSHDENKYNCIEHKPVEVIGDDFIEHVENNNLKYSLTSDALIAWFKSYSCKS
ncbi:hypothetical protein [Aeromonas enteropelogenes]|uniref:hypothetical protein n=1 Tax=Aeromonas enteropelogenes TaxID=29489 RepID=UPI0038D226F7